MTDKQEIIIEEVKRLKAELAELREFAYERAPKIAAEETAKQTAELRVELEEAQKQCAILKVQLSEEYRDWLEEQCNEDCRFGADRVVSEKAKTKAAEAKNAQLHAALKSIVDLMVSMQSLGYFTNPEWQSRLIAAELALGPKVSDGTLRIKKQ